MSRARAAAASAAATSPRSARARLRRSQPARSPAPGSTARPDAGPRSQRFRTCVDRVGGDPGAVGAEGQPGREAAAAGGRAGGAEHEHLVAGPGVGEVDVAVVPQRRQPLPVRGEPDATDAPRPRTGDQRARGEVPEVDLRLPVIRDGEPDPVRVERQGHDQAHAVQGPQHGPRLRVPGGDPARGALRRPAARREPAAVAAEGEGLDRVRPRLEGPDRPGPRPGARGSRSAARSARRPPRSPATGRRGRTRRP